LCAVGLQGPGGGTVFFVDTEGRYSDFDYLEAAPTDVTGNVGWSTDASGCGLGQNQSCLSNWINSSGEAIDFFAIGTGQEATTEIVARHDATDTDKNLYAAGAADVYATPTASDWWLPSQDELALMYSTLHLEGIGGFESSYYWTSSQVSSTNAWALGFAYGNESNDPKSNAIYVRAVRAF